MQNGPSVASSVLGFATTIHLAMLVLRVHRGPSRGVFSLVIAVSLLFSVSPWLLSTPLGVALGLAAHVAWFVACERLLPRTSQLPSSRPAAAAPHAAAPVPVTQMARRPREFVQVPILTTMDETPDIRTFRMARPDGFEFKAGQFLAVRVRADGKEHVRCYSISSAPDVRGYLEISVKRHGLVSGTLHATLRPGSTIAVKSPAGAFAYPGGEDRPVVLVAGGVGITPLMSMIRHAVHAEPNRPITLFYSVKTKEDIAFKDELWLLGRRHRQFRMFVAITQGPADQEHYPGRLNESLLLTTVPDLPHAACLVCGPRAMIDDVTRLLTGAGVPRAQIHFEIFDAAVAASAGASAEPGPADAPAPGTPHRLRFERSGITTKVAGTQTLLEAAEGCSAGIPSLCRAGVCGTCRTRVINGKVDCASRVLDDQDRADGFVLACVTHVNSDCTVDA